MTRIKAATLALREGKHAEKKLEKKTQQKKKQNRARESHSLVLHRERLVRLQGLDERDQEGSVADERPEAHHLLTLLV